MILIIIFNNEFLKYFTERSSRKVENNKHLSVKPVDLTHLLKESSASKIRM